MKNCFRGVNSGMLNKLSSKAGNEMVEAAIVLPIIILAVILILRLFTFYLEILDTGIKEHEKALEKSRNYSGVAFKIYDEHDEVRMLRGGLLGFDLKKEIDTRAYLINEDALVRAGELVDN